MDTRQFVLRFLLVLGFFFIIAYAPFSPLASTLNDFHTDLTLELLKPFIEKSRLKGIDIWINPHYKIYISDECSALIPILVLYAAILAYKSSLKRKIIWLLFGYVTFHIVNTLRILLVVYVTKTGEGQKEFYWSHDILGNALLMATGLLLFYTFIRNAKG